MTFRKRLKLILLAPQLAEVASRTLQDIEAAVGGRAAYGYSLNDENHPWHDTAKALRDVLKQLEEP